MPLKKYVRPILYSALLIVITFCAVAGWKTYQATANNPGFEQRILAGYGLDAQPHKGLDPQFTDSTGSLLADTPLDPAKLVDPQSISIAFIKSANAPESVDWTKLSTTISKSTTRPTTIDGFDNLSDELDAIKNGKVQVLIVHAADTPYLVNHFGFIPFAIAADSHGINGHRMTLIVRPKSNVQNPTDIKSHNLTCTQPLSIAGYRAAIAYLRISSNLRPNFDFTVSFSDSQKDSILGITGGTFDVAAVSSDKLRSMQDKGEITPDQYRVIYESEIIPRYAVGYFYNLKPDVAGTIKIAVLSFVNTPDPKDDARPERFIPTTYAKDFATVRLIDDSFDPRLTNPQKNPGEEAN